MHLQHPLLDHDRLPQDARLSFLVAIFAVEKVWLWSIFHDGAMGDGIQ